MNNYSFKMYFIDIDFGFHGSDNICYKNVNIKFNNGDIINIIGENGTGKSTFYKVLMGIEKPLRGSISKEISQNAVVVSDYVSIPKECAVKDVFAILQKDAISYIESNFTEIYKYVKSLENKNVGILSTGQKRILEIFCALSTRKRILIFDEACNGLDVYNRQILIDQIKKLSETKNIVIFNTSHYLEDIIEIGGRLLCLNKHRGCVIEYTEKKELQEVMNFMREMGRA